MAIEPIKVDGLAEFNRSLRALGKDAPKALRVANNGAAEVVVTYVRPRAPSGPEKGGHAASSVKARSTRTEARVSGGSKRFPYYPWLDFGGAAGPGKRIRRPFIKEGRYIWAGYVNQREEFVRLLTDALVQVGRDAGLPIEMGE